LAADNSIDALDNDVRRDGAERGNLQYSGATSDALMRRRETPAVVRMLRIVLLVVAAYAIGVSLFFALQLVSDFVSHEGPGGAWHQTTFFVLMGVAMLVLLLPLMQSDASRTARVFGAVTALMLGGFWALRATPSAHVDAPIVYLDRHVVAPLRQRLELRR